jgi:hypothetical protein
MLALEELKGYMWGHSTPVSPAGARYQEVRRLGGSDRSGPNLQPWG